jgi:hypothetical protein
MIAATSVLAIGGSLALAGSASAVPIPFGAPTDTGSTTVNGLTNQAYGGLEGADYVLNAVGDHVVPCTPTGQPPTCTGFPTSTALTTAQAQQIAADFTGQTIGTGTATVTAPTAHTPSYAVLAKGADPNYSTDAPKVAAAGTSWSQLSGLLKNLGAFPGLYSIDSDVTITSAATVAAKSSPNAYSITVATSGAAAGNYVLPNSFTMTFPNAFTVNTKLANAELQPSQEADPPAASAIGTVVLSSPVAAEFGGSGTTLTGSVFVVNANNNALQPDLELSFGSGTYLLGTFPSTFVFPLTLTFGEANTPIGVEPVPFSSLAIKFPAKTSPVKALSCTNLGQVEGTAVDNVAGLAAQFANDTADGYAATGNTPVALASTPTVVTNLCAPTTGKTTITGIKKGVPAVNITLKGNGGSKFSNAVITLPTGISAKGLKAKDLKVSGAKLKSVKASGAKVTVTFKSATKSATVNFAKGLSVTKKLKTAVTKKKTKSLAIKFTVKYATAASTGGSVTVKKLS